MIQWWIRGQGWSPGEAIQYIKRYLRRTRSYWLNSLGRYVFTFFERLSSVATKVPWQMCCSTWDFTFKLAFWLYFPIKFVPCSLFQLYVTLLAFSAFILPALIIITCYSIIVFVVWDKGRGFNSIQMSSACRTCEYGLCYYKYRLRWYLGI